MELVWNCIDIVYNQYWILVSSILLKYNFLILLFCFRRRKCIFMTQTKWVSTVCIDIWYYITSHWNSTRIELTWFTRREWWRFKNIYIIQDKKYSAFYRNLIAQIVSLLSDCILQVVVKKLLSSSVKHRYIKLWFNHRCVLSLATLSASKSRFLK